MSPQVVIDERGSLVTLQERFLDQQQASALFEKLDCSTPWQRHTVRMFGREHPVPRLCSWHGDDGATYRYSGTTHPPQAWTPPLLELRQMLTQALGMDFNSVLINRYRDGRDCMGWHADDEPELGPEPLIASISLGSNRDFVLKPRGRAGVSERRCINLASGSLLLMSGRTQHDWLHALPKRAREHRSRINLTWRQLLSAGAKPSP